MSGMTSGPIRILFLADSHLGFDLPTHPRVKRRRRGHDFLENHERAVSRALEGDIDLVIHGGDLFHRSRVPPSLVFQAFRSLKEVAEAGVPVFVVPGNHERARIPHDRFARHPNIRLFDRPRTFTIEVRGAQVALAGFPYRRKGVREEFPNLLKETGWSGEAADLRLLCIHHCLEGARVGPSNFTFRGASDVIRCADLPSDFAAVLSGHIHRHQILRRDLQGHPLPMPLFYPGSVERTAFAESGEEKGYLILEAAGGRRGGRILGHEFVRLPARPMAAVHLTPKEGPEGSWTPEELNRIITSVLSNHPRDAVLQLRVEGRVPPVLLGEVSASRLRERCPPEMNVQLLLTGEEGGSHTRRRRKRRSEVSSRSKGHTHPDSHGDQLNLSPSGFVSAPPCPSTREPLPGSHDGPGSCG